MGDTSLLRRAHIYDPCSLVVLEEEETANDTTFLESFQNHEDEEQFRANLMDALWTASNSIADERGKEVKVVHVVGKMFLELLNSKNEYMLYHEERKADKKETKTDKKASKDSPKQQNGLNRLVDGLLSKRMPYFGEMKCVREEYLSKHSIANGVFFAEWKATQGSNWKQAYVQSVKDYANLLKYSDASFLDPLSCYHLVGNGKTFKIVKVTVRGDLAKPFFVSKDKFRGSQDKSTPEKIEFQALIEKANTALSDPPPQYVCQTRCTFWMVSYVPPLDEWYSA